MGRGANGVGNIMKTSVMSARTTCLVSAGLLGALCALLPTVSLATTYTYTEGSSTDIVPAQRCAPQDNAGFPIGGAFGSSYFRVNSGPTILIGTNASGQITSWSITEGIFASYPIFPSARWV